VGLPQGRCSPPRMLAADPSVPTMEAVRMAASGSVPGPMRTGPAVRAPARQGVTTGQASRPFVRRLAVVGGEGEAPRSEGSTRRPPALLRAQWRRMVSGGERQVRRSALSDPVNCPDFASAFY